MSQSDAMLKQAIDAFQAGRLEDAERHFKELLAREPNHLAGLNLLGMVLTAARKFDEAEIYIQAAVAINANSDATHYNHGIVLKALKRPEQALASFDRALALNPAIADTWNNRGAVLNNLGRYDEAIAAFKKALELQPNHAGAFYNTGKSLAAMGRHDEALGFYDKSLVIDANAAEAWHARGLACNILRQPNEAATSFDRAINLRPDFAEAWIGLAGILSLAKQSEDALTAYDRALALSADFPAAWLGRALSLAQLKRTPEAIAAYREAVAHGVDAEQVNYQLAAIGAEPPPAATPPMNVALIFDQYAETFDQHLVESLNYKIPLAAADAVKRFAAKGGLDILDLGCGTGLAGEQLVSLKRTMTGVDLSPKMLDKARLRGVYDTLVCAELIEFLDTQNATADAVVCADVFVYIGDLAPVFRGVRRALRKDGLFCFSIEASEDSDFVVRESFRFAHSAAYIQRLALENGFTVEELTPAVIREDDEARIDGYLALLRCA